MNQVIVKFPKHQKETISSHLSSMPLFRKFNKKEINFKMADVVKLIQELHTVTSLQELLCQRKQ